MKAAAVATALWMAALLWGWHAISARTRPEARASYRLLEPPPLSRLEPRLLNVVTLGARPLYDDFATIWMLQILGDQKLRAENPDELTRTILMVTRHHPRFESLYMLSCFILGLDLGHPEACERVTLDGLKTFPESWRIPVTQGFMDAYKLNDPKQATLYYTLAASRSGAPAFLAKLAQDLAANNALSADALQATLDGLLGGAGAGAAAFLKGRKP